MYSIFAVCFCLAAVIFLSAALSALKLASKRHNRSAAYRVLCFGTILTAVLYYFPYYCDYFFGAPPLSVAAKSFFLSIHHAIRLFVVDVNYEEIRSFSAAFGLLGSLYSYFGILLFLVAPVLTFTFILSFLQDISATVLILFSPKRDYYVFTEVNLQSLYLAQDVREKHPDANIVFIGIDWEKKSEYEKIKTYTRHIHPALLSVDCMQMNHLLGRHKRNAHFFIIGENEEENSATILSILDATPTAGKRDIYVRLGKGDHLLDNLPPYQNTEIHRVEHIYSLVIDDLEKMGTRLFANARPNEKGEKVINALIVGLGGYGVEMIKNLSWFTQVEGYTARVHAFERDSAALEKLSHLCPGFFEPDTADRHFEVIVHPGLSYGTAAFDRELAMLGPIDFVFVTLGKDNLNANAALDIRTAFARLLQQPIIQAVYREGNASRLMSDSKTYRGASYEIEFIGSYEELYRLDFIADTQNRKAILDECNKWANHLPLSHEEQYRMVKSHIIHGRLLDALHISGESRKRSEHRRFVNFYFSEGYIPGPGRSEIAKQHKLLIPYDLLPPEFK